MPPPQRAAGPRVAVVQDNLGRFALVLPDPADEGGFVLLDERGGRWRGGVGWAPAWGRVHANNVPSRRLDALVLHLTHRDITALRAEVGQHETPDEHEALVGDFVRALERFIAGRTVAPVLIASRREAEDLLQALRLRQPPPIRPLLRDR